MEELTLKTRCRACLLNAITVCIVACGCFWLAWCLPNTGFFRWLFCLGGVCMVAASIAEIRNIRDSDYRVDAEGVWLRRYRLSLPSMRVQKRRYMGWTWDNVECVYIHRAPECGGKVVSIEIVGSSPMRQKAGCGPRQRLIIPGEDNSLADAELYLRQRLPDKIEYVDK